MMLTLPTLCKKEMPHTHTHMSPFMKFSLFPPLNVQFTHYRQSVMTHASLSQAWTSQFATHAAVMACEALEKHTDLKISF